MQFHNYHSIAINRIMDPFVNHIYECTEKAVYDYKYYACRRALCNIMNRCNPDQWDDLLLFDELSDEENYYIRARVMNDYEDGCPDVFKSPMKTVIGPMGSFAKESLLEKINGYYVPGKIIYAAQKMPSWVTDEMLKEYKHLGAYILLYRKETDPIQRLKYLTEFIKMTDAEFSTEVSYNAVAIELQDISGAMSKKVDEYMDETIKLRSVITDLVHRPPHHVECPECGNSIKIHCSEEVSAAKDHFMELRGPIN